jgi:hypothetical protein
MNAPALHDPFCYPLHVHPHGLQLVQLGAERFRAEPFHDHRLEGRYPDLGVVPYAPVLAHVRDAPLAVPHYVFHHAFSLSTLVSRWLDVPGRALCHREPLVLTELSQLELAQPGLLARADGAAALEAAVGLLRRREHEGEIALIKGCDSLTNIVPHLLAQHPAARAVLLYTDLDAFVISCLKAGSRRRWARDRAQAFLGWPDASRDRGLDVAALDDAEAVALLWLLQLQAYARLLAAEPDRLRAVYAEELLSDSVRSLCALAEFLGFGALTPAEAATRLDQPHAKTGESYDAAQRARELAALGQQLAAELVQARRFFERHAGEVVLGGVSVTAQSRV